MGRHKRSKRFKKQQDKRRKAHESDPERPGTETRENSPATAWSCDDQGLLDYIQNVGSDSEEMEVTKRLSFLNFEVIPCAIDTGNFSCGGHEHDASIAGGGCGGGVSDSVELYTSATTLDVLPGIGERESLLKRRQGRKRASRRKPNNKKVKKMKSSYYAALDSHGKVKRSFLPQLRFNPLLARGRDPCTHSAKGTFRSQRMEVDEDSVSCLFSDTSAVCDVEMFQDEDVLDSTPPAGPSDSGFPSHDIGCFGIESELSDSSTTDSGCEGDDEESSVEGPGRPRIPGWWEKEPLHSSTDEEDEKFSQILNGTFPLMSESSQSHFKERLSLSEFKHPGKFGIRGSLRKQRRKPTQTSCSLTPKEINQKIVSLVQSSETVLTFQLVSRAFCRTISNLARAYNLECVIEQKRRLPVASPILRKTQHTRMAERKEVEIILRNHGRDSPTTFIKERDPVVPVAGREVPRLDETNIGNRMLQNMGWRPGTGLGPQSNGIQDPILAYIRPRHMGLGY